MTDISRQVLPDYSLQEYDRDTATIMTGMTFDDTGEPLDYLKQVFASFELAEEFQQQGYEPEVYLLVADNFVEMNQGADGMSDALVDECAERRQNYLEAASEVFADSYPVNVEFTSDIKDDEYRRIVGALGDQVEQDEGFAQMLLEPVPDDKMKPDQTNRELTKYTREELATILHLGTDVKVGPKREKLYDVPARSDDVRRFSEEAEPVIGAYVSNTLPANLPEERVDEFREKGGLTPYKAGSKGLDPDTHRVLLTDDEEDLRQKLSDTPGELRSDLEEINRFMNQRGGNIHPDLAFSLNQNFDRIRGEL